MRKLNYTHTPVSLRDELKDIICNMLPDIENYTGRDSMDYVADIRWDEMLEELTEAINNHLEPAIEEALR